MSTSDNGKYEYAYKCSDSMYVQAVNLSCSDGMELPALEVYTLPVMAFLKGTDEFGECFR